MPIPPFDNDYIRLHLSRDIVDLDEIKEFLLSKVEKWALTSAEIENQIQVTMKYNANKLDNGL